MIVAAVLISIAVVQSWVVWFSNSDHDKGSFLVNFKSWSFGGASPKPVSANVLSPRDLTGSWLGNTWIPPYPWKHFSAEEMREIYGRRRTVWVGDETARRAAMTMFSVLNGTTVNVPVALAESEIDINKRKETETCPRWSKTLYTNEVYPVVSICRPVQPTGDLAMVSAVCLQHVKRLLSVEIERGGVITPSFDVMIVSLGIWHHTKESICRLQAGETLTSLVQDISRLMHQLLASQPHLKFVWRTSGWIGTPMEQQQQVLEINKAIMDSVDNANNTQKQISYVNWGGAMEARSFGYYRLGGNEKEVYDLEPRLALIQMITNQLQSMEDTPSAAG